jgi:molybdate transport system substrate-binding protein
MPAHAGDVNLSVAASLRETVTELSANFAKDNPGVTFKSNFSGSGALAKQIESGAPADLFFSANLEWMDYLKEKKALDEKHISTFAFNVLVFVGKPDVKVKTMQDLVRLNRIAIGSPKSVPCGQYAMEALKNSGIDTQLKNKLVMARDVRECLMYAERGEVDGAFVYKTDVQEIAKSVKVLFTVPQDLYPRATYPVALTTAGGNKAEAVAFYRFLLSDEAKAILTKHGFAVK